MRRKMMDSIHPHWPTCPAFLFNSNSQPLFYMGCSYKRWWRRLTLASPMWIKTPASHLGRDAHINGDGGAWHSLRQCELKTPASHLSGRRSSVSAFNINLTDIHNHMAICFFSWTLFTSDQPCEKHRLNHQSPLTFTMTFLLDFLLRSLSASLPSTVSVSSLRFTALTGPHLWRKINFILYITTEERNYQDRGEGPFYTIYYNRREGLDYEDRGEGPSKPSTIYNTAWSLPWKQILCYILRDGVSINGSVGFQIYVSLFTRFTPASVNA